MESLTFTQELNCPLSDEEVAERSKLLARAVLDREVAEAAKKEEMGKHATILKEIDKKIATYALAVEERAEKRPVSCAERPNTRLFRFEKIRLDTSEVFDVRPMTEKELSDAQQGKLFADAAAESAAAGDQRTETNTLAKHDVLPDPFRAPDDRVPCPGPEGGKGCTGEDCKRCAGALFIPAPVASEAATAEGDAPAEDAPGTEITDPAAVAGPEPTPEGGGRHKRERRDSARAH